MSKALQPNESVGEKFEDIKIKKARDLTLKVLQEVAASLAPGMTELQAKAKLLEVQTKYGASKTWHPPQVRFGENTLLPFGVQGKRDIELKENDIFFIDIGPVFDDHEGDVGRAFTLGNDPDMKKCVEDVEAIWHEVQQHWKDKGATGPELYAFAAQKAKERGWELSLKKANGHRIADFPHAARIRGTIEGWEETPQANRWILEIQIRHKDKAFGAFYEDLLN